MININLICIGKLKEQYLRDACAEYIKRLGTFCKITVT
ncbi:MAG: 23S rRNA (pseudouridine(1915)-N(3))-methyltransferase RlmH, partial [Clostridia bacterium]|nr:23S rRNA (pseudouridine(1915)-N(3))-methyltransferase RlmH [Clostridia bacterium]